MSGYSISKKGSISRPKRCDSRTRDCLRQQEREPAAPLLACVIRRIFFARMPRADGKAVWHAVATVLEG